MGRNVPLPEGHSFFSERDPRGFKPYSREMPNPGKGRLHLVQGHGAISEHNPEAPEIERPKLVEQSPQAIELVEEHEDRGQSEVEILLRTPPAEFNYRIGDVF